MQIKQQTKPTDNCLQRRNISATDHHISIKIQSKLHYNVINSVTQKHKTGERNSAGQRASLHITYTGWSRAVHIKRKSQGYDLEKLREKQCLEKSSNIFNGCKFLQEHKKQQEKQQQRIVQEASTTEGNSWQNDASEEQAMIEWSVHLCAKSVEVKKRGQWLHGQCLWK